MIPVIGNVIHKQKSKNNNDASKEDDLSKYMDIVFLFHKAIS